MALSGLVLFRAKSGPTTGMGHVMRSRSIAQEVVERGGRVLLVVDDAATCEALASDELDVVTVAERPDWAETPARGAWLDGFVDWSAELSTLAAHGTPGFLVENRTTAREQCERLVYPSLHYVPDDWDVDHAERILAGPGWIPLARDVRGMNPAVQRDVDLLITFGGSDPFHMTERILPALDLSASRIVVAIGPHMAERRDEISALVRDLDPLADVRILLPGMPLARWIARSKMAVTAVGTTLYELAYLGVPALIIANYADDRGALAWYEAHGPHLPLGVGADLSQEGLRAALNSCAAELRTRAAPHVPGLGDGATRLALELLGRAA